MVSYSVQAALTEFNRMGGLYTTGTYFSLLQRLEVQDQGVSRVGFLVKACPLAADSHLLAVSSHSGRDERAL